MVNDKMQVCDTIAEFLEKKNIKILFGITGGTNVFLFDAIMRRGFTKVVYVHHEQAAVMSAGAYYRASGNLAGVIVTAGGGASNAITGTLSNWADSIPCLIMSGQEGTGYVKDHEDLRMLGTQGFNVTDSVKNMTKYAKCITDENDVLFHLDKAYHICTEGRPGPVWLDIPGNIQNLKIDKDTVDRFSPPADHDQTRIDLDDIVKLLENSKRPVIMAGHGISLSKSNKQFRELVDKFNIPVLLTYSGINILEHEHPLNFGTSGLYGQRRSNFIVQNCDLLLVLGSRLAIPQVGYNIENFARDAKIIMVNNDVGELKKISRCVPVHADCKDFIESLSNHELNKNYEEWVARCKKYSDDFPIIEKHHLKDNEVYDNSYVLINELSDLLPADNIISIGQGSPLPCTHQAFKFKKNQIAFASNGLGEMGNGLPSAIGASFSNPKTHHPFRW